ncbi:hypothetical protein ACSBR1_011474 [Camellia fascicularis]
MAETVVFHLLANFAPYLQQEAHLLTGVQNEIEYIRDEFDRMMSFLRVTDAIEENDPELKVWVNQVHEAAYDIGDVLDLFMLRLGHRHGHGFCGFLHKVSYFIKASIARHQIASEVQRMKSKVDNISGHQRYHDRYGMLEQGSSSSSSRVVLTTRNADLASFSSKEYHRDVYNLQSLPPKESWTLFCRKTFMENSCPSYLEGLSRAILKRCKGLPLAIVAISGLYQTPSVFPEDYLIEHRKLIRLWVAEGFVEMKVGMTIEEVVEAYLNELINRSIVQVAQMRSDGRVQTYRIHDLWHEIIVSKSGEQNIVTIAGEQKRVWP